MNAKTATKSASFVRAMDHKNPTVVAAAIRGLGKTAPMSVAGLEKVRKLSDHTSPVVRSACQEFMAARKNREEFKPPRVVVADYSANKIVEFDEKGRQVFAIKDLNGVWDVEALATGNLLQQLTIRMLNEVREVDKKGKTVWSLKQLSSPSDADRLPDGTTLVSESGFVRIYDAQGAVLWQRPIQWAVEANAVGVRK